MSEKNKDGLVPGQLVDFTTLMRVKRQAKAIENEQPESVTKPVARKSGRKAKASNSDE